MSKPASPWETSVLQWIGKVTGAKIIETDVWSSLKSGVVLCQLVNSIKPGTITRAETKLLPMIEMENIQLYLTALWGMGVPSLDLFITSDLYRGENLTAVLQSVHALSVIAVGIGWVGPEFPVNPEKKAKSGMKKSRSLASLSSPGALEELGAQVKIDQLKSQIGKHEEQNRMLSQQLQEERANVTKLQEIINDYKRKDRQTLQLSEASKQKEVEIMRNEILALQLQVKNFKQAAEKHAAETQRESNKLQLKEFEVGDLKETVEHLRNHLREVHEDESDDDDEEYVVEVKTFTGNSALKPSTSSAMKPSSSSSSPPLSLSSASSTATTATTEKKVSGPSPPPPRHSVGSSNSGGGGGAHERGRSPSARHSEPAAHTHTAAVAAAAATITTTPEIEAAWRYDPKERIRTHRATRMAAMIKPRKSKFATVELKLSTDEHEDDDCDAQGSEQKPSLLKQTSSPPQVPQGLARPSHQRASSSDSKPTSVRSVPALPVCTTHGCTKYRVVAKQHCAEHCVSQLNISAGIRPSTTVSFTSTATSPSSYSPPFSSSYLDSGSSSSNSSNSSNNNNNSNNNNGGENMDHEESGQFFFRAEEGTNLNSTTVLLAQRHLKQLLRNRKLSFKNAELLSELFRTDSGRRVLVYILGSMCKTQTSHLQLTQDNFEIIHHLVENTLREMDIKLSKDIKSVMLLMRATRLLAWKSHGEERILRDYLLTHFADLPFSFWEEYYWRNMTGTSRHTMHAQLKANEQEMGWMKELFIETGFDMYTFGTSRTKIKEFIQHMILLTPGFTLVNQVYEAVENYPNRYYEMNGRAQSPSELMAMRATEDEAPPSDPKAKIRWQVTETRGNLKKFAEPGEK